MSQLSLDPWSYASLSACHRYRYTLTRTWSGGRPMLFVMLNPSTADSSADDPTIRRCLGFAQREGYPAIEVVNLFAWRATDPTALLLATDPIGPANNVNIEEAAARAGVIVAAWGEAHLKTAEGKRRFAGRSGDVLRLLAPHGDIYTLGRTASDAPRHPLYLRSDAPLELLAVKQ